MDTQADEVRLYASSRALLASTVLAIVFIVGSVGIARHQRVVAGVFVGVGVLAVALFMPLRLVLDRAGFRLVALVPLRRRLVRWTDVDTFFVDSVRGRKFVAYSLRSTREWRRTGERDGSFPTHLARRWNEEPLSVEELCLYLSSWLARTRVG